MKSIGKSPERTEVNVKKKNFTQRDYDEIYGISR